MIRGLTGLLAAALTALAAGIDSLDSDAALVPFFVLLTLAGGVVAWAVQPPFSGGRRRFVQVVAVAWGLAGIWAAGLLLAFPGSQAAPGSEPLYLGLPASAYHAGALHAGAILVLLGAFGPDRWFTRDGPDDAAS
jgi:hypothetical protein